MNRYIPLLLIFFSFNLHAQIIAKIDSIVGEVVVNGIENPDVLSLQVGDIVEAKAKLKPKKTGSFVRIIFNNGDKLGVSDGKIIIEEFNKKQSVFSLIRGRIFNYAKPGLKRKLKIKSRNVALGVRGTKYMVDESKKETYVCVCEGEVEATKGGRTSSIKAGYDLHVLPGKPINQSVEASKMIIKMVSDGFILLGEPVVISK
jgi:hypothetical protein